MLHRDGVRQQPTRADANSNSTSAAIAAVDNDNAVEVVAGNEAMFNNSPDHDPDIGTIKSRYQVTSQVQRSADGSKRNRNKKSKTSYYFFIVLDFILAVLYELQPFRFKMLFEISYKDVFWSVFDYLKFYVYLTFALVKLFIRSTASFDKGAYYRFMTNYLSWLVLWIAVLVASIQYKVFNLFGMLTLIYLCFSLTTADSSSGNAGSSAYSVFNKGNYRLPGTFTAEDIDRQIRNGFM